jgi:ElaB/YqjD/DUF883 family membrane-anchored ribosome-binding protein
MESQTDTTQGLGNELISDAKGIGASAVNRLHEEVDARKSGAVTQAQAVSSTIERAADGLDDDAPAWLKSALQQGAQKVQQLADTLDNSDSRQIVQQVNDFARNSPATFLGACAAAGFAAARIFKAGSGQNTPDQLNAVSPIETDTGQNFAQTYEQNDVSPQGAML